MSSTPITDQMRRSGNWNEAWNEFAELDPQWTEKFMDMGTLPMRSGVLDRKTIELIFLAVNASCTHLYEPGVRRHIRGALDQGATKEEIMAVLSWSPRSASRPARSAHRSSRKSLPRARAAWPVRPASSRTNHI
jgi:alkylhydroperoxidase/carboxymuconolactone decarboxylase family protein YurZ